MLKLTFITHAVSREHTLRIAQTVVSVASRVPPKEQVGEPSILFENSIG
jgi:hypothetical protein